MTLLVILTTKSLQIEVHKTNTFPEESKKSQEVLTYLFATWKVLKDSKLMSFIELLKMLVRINLESFRTFRGLLCRRQMLNGIFFQHDI